MAKVGVELKEKEYDMLRKLAVEQKRTCKAQAEWLLVDRLREREEVLELLSSREEGSQRGTPQEANPCE